jgi:hypothetical protein
LFTEIPDITESPQHLIPNDFDSNLIQTLLNTSSIIAYFDTNIKSYYLQLFSNSTFYIIDPSINQIFSFGPHYNNNNISNLSSKKTQEIGITVDELQQHFLRNGIVQEDIGSNVIINMQCGQLPFTLGKIKKVTNQQVTISIYNQQNIGLDEEWQLLNSFTKKVSKESCLIKGIEFTKNMVLKKKWKIYLEKNYEI